MSMYLYNTAPLPWYPAEWNKTVLPFAVVYRMVGSDAVPTHRMLCCSESPYVTEVDGVQVIAIPPGSNHNFTHFSGNDFWHDIGSNDELANAETFGYLNPSEYEFVWCYISIYDEAGNLVYPGSTPTLIEEEEPEPEPEEFDLQSFKTGLAIYLSIRPCVFPQRSPVAFLYNGVRLPKVPVVEGFEFSLITGSAWTTDENIYHLYISSTPLCVSDLSETWGENLSATAEGSKIHYRISEENGDTDWVRVEELDKTYLPGDNIGTIGGIFAKNWANYDVLWDNGTVYLAASEPVPAYE